MLCYYNSLIYNFLHILILDSVTESIYNFHICKVVALLLSVRRCLLEDDHNLQVTLLQVCTRTIYICILKFSQYNGCNTICVWRHGNSFLNVSDPTFILMRKVLCLICSITLDLTRIGMCKLQKCFMANWMVSFQIFQAH